MAKIYVVVGVDGGCIDTVDAYTREENARRRLAEVDGFLGIERDADGHYDHATASAGLFETELE